MSPFHAPVQQWFSASFAAPTRAQELGWPPILAGRHTLIHAPTGSGKTLAAFLAAIDTLMFDPVPGKLERCRVLYVSPLKALAVDVDRNLRAPLVGIGRAAERLEVAAHRPTVAIRTGDTPSADRARFRREPADVLITTPESLYLLLTSDARAALRSVRTVIVDEVHALVATKRGSHLALSLERLAELTAAPFQRIGLSATQRPLDEVARFLGGCEGGSPRPVEIVDAGSHKALELRVTVPVEDMSRLGELEEIPTGPASQADARTSIWPSMHPLILDLIRAHRSTLVFVNSRRLAERLAGALNDLAGEPIVRAHHGSIAREQRLLIEDELKSGTLPAMVATSTLELGIDMGAIDLVIQVEAPPSVASGMQRIGRAGHRIDEPSTGVILPKFRGDLLACAALVERMKAGAVEQLRYPRSPLDVLAQQIAAIVAMDEWRVDDVERLVRRAAPYAELPRTMLDSVLDMLSGRYPSDEFAELRPRVVWDRTNGTLRTREGTKRLAITSGGTIPDRGLYGVFLLAAEKGKGRVGELDEEMVFESRVGDVFLLGASSWRIEEITHDRVLVSPAPGVPGKMPFWKGDGPGRPLEFGRAIGRLTRTLRELQPGAGAKLLRDDHSLDDNAARNLLQYLREQAAATEHIPDDRTIVIERSLDDMGDWRVCMLSPFGGRVHAPWAIAIEAALHARTDADIAVLWSDDGIVVRFPQADTAPSVDPLLPDPDDVEELVRANLGSTALFAGRFREAAARALLLPKRFPGQRAPLWQQRKRSADLLAATAHHGSFPIILETYRECLQDVFDMPALVGLLREIRDRRMRVVTVDTASPSPFAAALLFNYVGNFMYEGDQPLAERRAQALTIDPAQLRELLGEVELRDLLDENVIADFEQWLQHLIPERAARHADGLHELLLRIGDLSRDEVAHRVAGGAGSDGGAAWLAELERDRRIARLQVAGEERFVAAEDAARYRDALGIPTPPGLPGAFLEAVDDPLADLVSRYLRTHGPVGPSDVASRLGIGEAAVVRALDALTAAGRAVAGEFRPGRSGQEWCDAGVLRAIRQRSLARLRHEVEPVEAAALGRFLPRWHGIGERGTLERAVEQLQGAAIPASVLERDVLPARLADYDARDLDRLTLSGSLVWVGRGAIGPSDGRISLYRTDALAALHVPPVPLAGDLHARIREHLASRGASFFGQIHATVGGFAPELVEAIWDLVWAGEITNDTLEPLRARIRPVRRQGRPMPRAPRDVPPDATGRWSLVAGLAPQSATPAERAAALAQQLLERHGVLTREAVQAEEVAGGFSAVYGVLKLLEEAGRVRRGYFVAGRGATQFALPGATERLRAVRDPGPEPECVVLAATDPAQPHGAALPWPERAEGRRPMRSAGAIAVLVDGALAAWLGRDERQVLTFVDVVPERDGADVRRAIAGALATRVDRGIVRALVIDHVDGVAARSSPMADALGTAGFIPTARGFLKRRA
ncbi:MAG: DEAD/DEAH box helicase [Candidatus Limnocylindria bacterium]